MAAPLIGFGRPHRAPPQPEGRLRVLHGGVGELTSCLGCWPPAPATPWPPSTGANGEPAPSSTTSERRPRSGARPAPARTVSGSTTATDRAAGRPPLGPPRWYWLGAASPPRPRGPGAGLLRLPRTRRHHSRAAHPGGRRPVAHRGVPPGGDGRGRPGLLPGVGLHRLVPARHPGDARPRLRVRPVPPQQKEAGRGRTG